MDVVIGRDRFDAVIFDLDGVVTDTASVHAQAWAETFDEILATLARARRQPFRPFTLDDYLDHVDGKPRSDGVRDFLDSRGVKLPEGSDDDGPEVWSIVGVGRRKNERFRETLDRDGVVVFETTVALIDALRLEGFATAVISASRNCRAIIEVAGLVERFDARVDGEVAGELGLPGKPDPAVFLEAARRLDVAPRRAVVVEDARAGVQAGAAGGFGLVVGVDRTGHPDELRRAGADVVVADLAQVTVGSRQHVAPGRPADPGRPAGSEGRPA